MIATWMAWAILVGMCLAAGAALLDWALRAFGRATRWVWLAALLGTTILTIAALLDGPPRRAHDGDPATIIESPSTQAHDVIGLWRAALAQPARWMAPVAERLAPLDGPLLVLWTAGSALFGVLLLLAHRRLSRERATWPVEHMAGSQVRVSTDLGPAVVGWRRPEIVVPRWALAMTRDEQRLIVLHEREHLEAGDQHLLALTLLLVLLAPWNPAHWWMLQRLRLAIEIDCDRRALRAGAALRSYGELLVRLGSRGRRTLLPVAALAERGSTLVRRVRAFTAAPPRARWVSGGVAGAIAVLLVGTAGAFPVPAPAPSSARPPARAPSPSATRLDSTRIDAAVEPVSRSDSAPGERPALGLREIPPPPRNAAALVPERSASDSISRMRRSTIATPAPTGRGGRGGGGGGGGGGGRGGRYSFDSSGARRLAPAGAVIRARAVLRPADTTAQRPPF